MIRPLLACLILATPALAEDAPLIARGNEPGWVLTLAPEGMVLSTESGERVETPLPQALPFGMGLRHDASPDLVAEVLPLLCHDSMTGMPYPKSVSVIRGEERLTGCGGDPLSLLQGDWQVTRLEGMPSSGLTLEVAGDRLAGRSACNRYTTALTLTGETLTIAAPAATRMACPAAAMQTEAAFFALLGRVSGFDLGSDGALLLLGEGKELLRATR